jgi:hypothetical protein
MIICPFFRFAAPVGVGGKSSDETCISQNMFCPFFGARCMHAVLVGGKKRHAVLVGGKKDMQS